MAIDRNDIDERQARLDVMIAEFRAAQQRQTVKQGIALWNRTELAQPKLAAYAALPPEKLN